MILKGLVGFIIFVLHVHSEIISSFTICDFFTNGRDSLHVFGKVNNVSWHNTRNVVPFMFLVSKYVILKTIFNLLHFYFFQKLFLLLPFMHLHIILKWWLLKFYGKIKLNYILGIIKINKYELFSCIKID